MAILDSFRKQKTDDDRARQEREAEAEQQRQQQEQQEFERMVREGEEHDRKQKEEQERAEKERLEAKAKDEPRQRVRGDDDDRPPPRPASPWDRAREQQEGRYAEANKKADSIGDPNRKAAEKELAALDNKLKTDDINRAQRASAEKNGLSIADSPTPLDKAQREAIEERRGQLQTELGFQQEQKRQPERNVDRGDRDR